MYARYGVFDPRSGWIAMLDERSGATTAADLIR